MHFDLDFRMKKILQEVFFKVQFPCSQVCAVTARERVAESLALSYAEAPGRPLPDVIAQPGLSYDEVLHDDFRFDLNAHDVMVFLHIQKTGGTSFGKHLVMDLDLKVCS